MKMIVWVAVFLLYTLVVYIVQYQSVLYYLWGIRNNFRFYAAFFAVAYFWKMEHVARFYKFLDGVYWINFLVALVQYCVLGIEGDYLGGIFGTQPSVNGYSVLLFTIVLTKSIVSFLENREPGWKCGAKFLIATVLSSLAELKFFYVILLVLVAMALAFTEFSWRKLILVFGTGLCIAVGTVGLAVLYEGDSEWFTLEWLYSVVADDRGYTSSGDLNRLNAFSRINEIWHSGLAGRLFGMGLGNCDTATMAAMNTPFFEKYGYMHYSWMSHAIMYLECGWMGVVFLFGFFALVFFEVRKIEKLCNAPNTTYCRISKIMAVVCMFVLIYNSSLRTEAAYMVYLTLAIPFAYRNQEKFVEKPTERVLVYE